MAVCHREKLQIPDVRMDAKFNSSALSRGSVAGSVPVPISSDVNVPTLNSDFHFLTSTPFPARTTSLLPSASPAEDSAICIQESFDRSSHSVDTPKPEWCPRSERRRRTVSPIPRRSAPTRHSPIYSMTCESLNLATDERKYAPCLRCCRAKSHSDSELFSYSKYNASEVHPYDSFDLVNSRESHSKSRVLNDECSKFDAGNTSQDTGYDSNCSRYSTSLENSTRFMLTGVIQARNQDQARQLIVASPTRTEKLCHPHFKCDEFSKQLLEKYAPKVLDRLIGRKIGLRTVDFIGELKDLNLSHIIGLLLAELSKKDLASICQVSKSWAEAVHSDPAAKRRLLSHRRKQQLNKKLQKENCGKGNSSVQCLVTRSHGALTEVQWCIRAKNDQLKQSSELSQKYWKEAKQLKNEEALRRCPKCSSPARTEPLQDRASCTKLGCKFDFCIRCQQPFHGSKDCAIATTPKKQLSPTKIGSKKSKKNLRRL